jgi:creatinine amidohydrolase
MQIGHYTREQVAKLAPSSLAILPIGAIEQHGNHLPLHTDYCIIEHISHRVSQKVKDEMTCFVCPSIPYGNSHHHFPYSALSLTSETLIRVLKDLVASLAITGFKHVFILNSHGGNDEAIRIVTRDAAREHQITVASASYWTLAYDRLSTYFTENHIELGRVPGHAGGLETSMMLSLDEANVHLESRPALRQDPVVTKDMRNRVYIQRPGNTVGIDGVSDDARNASKAIGDISLTIIVEEVAACLKQFYNG